jgi:hypothetical protein
MSWSAGRTTARGDDFFAVRVTQPLSLTIDMGISMPIVKDYRVILSHSLDVFGGAGGCD